MALPHWTNVNILHDDEPIYIPLFEAIIKDNSLNEEFITLLESIFSVNDVNNELELEVRLNREDIVDEYILKTLRKKKLDFLIDGLGDANYEIRLNKFDRKGDIINSKNYKKCVFIGGSKEKIRFSYELCEEEMI
jgi:hypothetical protein